MLKSSSDLAIICVAALTFGKNISDKFYIKILVYPHCLYLIIEVLVQTIAEYQIINIRNTRSFRSYMQHGLFPYTKYNRSCRLRHCAISVPKPGLAQMHAQCAFIIHPSMMDAHSIQLHFDSPSDIAYILCREKRENRSIRY